jgi:cell division protease FtsH
MVMEFGMSAKVGPINIADHGPRFLSPAFRRGDDVSEETEVAIDREVKALLMNGQDKARRILTARRADLEQLARVLLERETLDRKDLEKHFEGDGAESPEQPDSTDGVPAVPGSVRTSSG